MNYRRFTYRLIAIVILLSMVLMTHGGLDTSQTLPTVHAQGGQNGNIFISAPVTPLIFTGDLRDLPAPVVGPPQDVNPRLTNTEQTNTASIGGGDALAQANADAPITPVPDVLSSTTRNFDGILFQGPNPSDINGDVGPNHYIQITNSSPSSAVHIYDKATPMPALLVNTRLQNIWIAAGGSGSCATNGFGDPIVLWDGLADRWFMTEFTGGGDLCIYISRSPDPVSGGWYLYQFTSLPGGFPDYPKYAVWPDAYYMASNSGPRQWAFDRHAMLLGDPSTFQSFTVPGLDGFGFETLTPADLDGATPPPLGTPGIFMRHVDTEAHPSYSGGGQDYLEIWTFDVDFFDPSNSNFTGPLEIPVAEFDSDLCGLSTFSCIPEPGGPALDPLREVIMWRLAYRNFNGSQRLVGNLVTDLTANDQAGVRWFELRNGGSGWSLYQEGTLVNATGTGGSWDGVHRWMAASAMDGSGNIAVGYNVSNSTTVFPGIRYNGRRASDPLNTMTQGEKILVNGTGANGSFRWGDYSAMSIDPSDDCTFWNTNNYGVGGQWRTRIGTFNFGADCTTPANTADVLVTITDETTNANQSQALTYNVIVSNPGPSNAASINVNSNFSNDIENVSWTCAVTGTGTGNCPASGTANIAHTINLDAGEFATYTVNFNVTASAPPGSTLSSSITAVDTSGNTDPNPANNTGSDDNTLINGSVVIANDNYANATTINVPTSITQNINGSTLEGNDPVLPCIGSYTNSVWYHLSPGTAFKRVTATSTDYDVAIGIVNGTPGNFNVLACDDNSAGSTHATTGISIENSDAYVIVVNNNSTPVASSSNVHVVFEHTTAHSALVMFNPSNSATSALETLFSNPPATAYDNFTNNPPVVNNNEWVMGDWNGDGVETPGFFSAGAFRYTNDYGGNSDWSSPIWLGNAGTRRDLLAGRFNPGGFNNDCIGWIDGNTSPATGNLRFSLKYWCDMSASGAVPLSVQFIGGILGNSAGFTGTFQFVGGDWDNDDTDEVAIRRGSRIAYTLVDPSAGAATFGQAQRWDVGGGVSGPGGNGLDAGIFISGDWNGDGQDGWGVLYDNNDFYYRSSLLWNPGPWQFIYQQVSNGFGAGRQADTHMSAFGGEGIPNAPLTFGADSVPGGPVDTSRNVEADLSVSKAGNFQVGEVGLVGDTITWTITVANTGTAPANGVQITDNVPSELRVDDAYADEGTVTVHGQQVSFNVASIGVGETAQFKVVTTILAQPSSGLFNNSVNVLLPDGGTGGSDANLVASSSVNTVDGLPSTGYTPKFRW